MKSLDRDDLEDYNECRRVWNCNLPTVKTQQLDRAFSIIDQVMASNLRDGSSLRGSVVIDSLPGLGKTTIATRYGREFHRHQIKRRGSTTAEGHQRLPVAFVPLSAGMTLKTLNVKLLEFYGHPAAQGSTRAQLGSLAVDCILSCETQIVIVDDLHFIDFRHRQGTEVSNHLKWLANEMPVTFIYVGVGLADKAFFDEGLDSKHSAYAQTSRRATRCPVTPFRVGSDDGLRAWVDLLRAFEQHICLADSKDGMLTDSAPLLYKRTQGHIASLTNLLDRACHLAILSGRETLDKEVLANVTVDNAAQSSTR